MIIFNEHAVTDERSIVSKSHIKQLYIDGDKVVLVLNEDCKKFMKGNVVDWDNSDQRIKLYWHSENYPHGKVLSVRELFTCFMGWYGFQHTEEYDDEEDGNKVEFRAQKKGDA